MNKLLLGSLTLLALVVSSHSARGRKDRVQKKYGIPYKGCYKDVRYDRDIGGKPYRPNPITPAICVEKCKALSMKFAALQGGATCRCGNKFGRHGKVMDFLCNALDCRGTTNRMKCGGKTYNAIYATGATPLKPPTTPAPQPKMRHGLKYIGCYKDEPIRDLAGVKPFLRPYPNSPEKCIRECQKKGKFKYAGVQIGYACFCGNSVGRYGKAQEKECSYGCNGKSGQMCGGARRNSVYLTSSLEPIKKPPRIPKPKRRPRPTS